MSLALFRKELRHRLTVHDLNSILPLHSTFFRGGCINLKHHSLLRLHTVNSSNGRQARFEHYQSARKAKSSKNKTKSKRGLKKMGDLARAEIYLDETESRIRKLLLDASTYIDQKDSDRSEDLVLRLTGGWVRDKLLNYESHDLDVSINRMTGYDFACKLEEFLSHNSKQYGESLKGIYKVAMNPEKSKHLETASARLYGVDLDFVNLRTETYVSDSRIPGMTFGTAEEDAYRRDATINALFYNLHTGKIEDYTQRGLDDLRNGVIDTPLPALETFADDPLRVLRLIRFASRFGFTISERTFEAMKSDEINVAVRHKVSKERIGVEVNKMLLGRNANIAASLLVDTNIYSAIIKPPASDISGVEYDMGVIYKTMKELVLVLHALLASESGCMIPKLSEDLSSSETSLLLYLFALCQPWGEFTIDKSLRTPFIIVRDYLKLPSSRAREVSDIVLHVDKAAKCAHATEWTRLNIGLTIREFGKNWRLVFFSALACDIQKIPNKDPDSLLTSEPAVDLIKRYTSLQEYIMTNKLDNAWSIKPIIDGKAVMRATDLRSGPWLTKVLQKVIAWQLEFPEKSADDCIEYVKTLDVAAL